MPHQCVKCGKVITDGSRELLDGCTDCNSRFFFFIKNNELRKEATLINESLSETEINEMEKDVRTLVGQENTDKPLILDIETIRTLKPGKFSIDVNALMRGEPIIINISEGKYYIDLQSAFKKGTISNELLKKLK